MRRVTLQTDWALKYRGVTELVGKPAQLFADRAAAQVAADHIHRQFCGGKKTYVFPVRVDLSLKVRR